MKTKMKAKPRGVTHSLKLTAKQGDSLRTELQSLTMSDADFRAWLESHCITDEQRQFGHEQPIEQLRRSLIDVVVLDL